MWEATAGVTPTPAFRYAIHVPSAISHLDPSLSSVAVEAVSLARGTMMALSQSEDVATIEKLAIPLMRVESLSSSRIEGLSIGHRELAIAIANPDKASRTAREIVNNITATDEAVHAFDGVITSGTFLSIHKRIFTGTRFASIAGVYRDRQSWISRFGDSPKGADYVPPPPGEIQRLMGDLAAFCNRTDLSPIVQAAIAHAQFELVHPFFDGNGRTGRALIHGIFRKRQAATFTPPISAALLRNTSLYIAGIRAYKEGNIDNWVTYFSNEVSRATIAAAQLAKDVRNAENLWLERAGKPRAGSLNRKVIGRLVQMPILDAASLAQAEGVREDVARRALDQLQESGVIAQIGSNKRGRVWIGEDVMKLLDHFERVLATAQDTQGTNA